MDVRLVPVAGLLVLGILLLSCDGDFERGSRVRIALPPAFEPGFEARSFLMQTPAGPLPPFKLAATVVAGKSQYFCRLQVVQEAFVMWSAGCLSMFSPVEACVISLSLDGNLVLSDAKGNVGWSSNTSGRGVKYIQLKRTGNLVLRNRFRVMVWQSFDTPCDILLWGQRLRPGRGLLSAGGAHYTLSLQGNELVLSWQGLRYWKASVRGPIDIAQLGAGGIELLTNGDIATVVGPEEVGLIVRFAVLGQSGGLTLYGYGPPWAPVFEAPGQFCDFPESCGPYGICEDGGSNNYTVASNNVSNVNRGVISPHEATCTCPPYFRPYGSGDTRGCDLPAGFRLGFCAQPAEMLELVGLDVPVAPPTPGPGRRRRLSRGECAEACLADCACVAATSSNESDCQLYYKMGSIRKRMDMEGSRMFLKVPKGLRREESCGERRIHMLILILGASVDALALVVVVAAIFYYFCVYKKRRRRESAAPSQS